MKTVYCFLLITATWIQPNGAPVLTYTLIGTVISSSMTGTITSVGTGISSTGNFTFTAAP